jgi:hypothetical protein
VQQQVPVQQRVRLDAADAAGAPPKAQPVPDGGALDIEVLKRQIGNEPAAVHALLEDFLGPGSGELAISKGTAVAE